MSSLPADMSAPALLSTVSAATATATTLFLICKSRLMRVSPYEKNLIAHHREQPKRNPHGKMLFVSQIGTSKALATRLCDLLESKHVVLDLVDARNYEPEALPKENLVVLVASTSEVWNLSHSPARNFSSNRNLPWGAKFFVNWIEDKANGFKVGAFVVNACSFSAFVVGREVTEGGKNLMAKAANEISDLGLTAESNADFDSWWGSAVAVLQGAVLGDGDAADVICGESEPEDVGSSDPNLSMTQRLYMLVENEHCVIENTEPYVSYTRSTRHRMFTITEDNFMKNGTVELEEGGRVIAQWPLRDDIMVDGRLPRFHGICSVGRCIFFAGVVVVNLVTKSKVDLDDGYSSKLWCLKYEDSTWYWSLCGSMFCSQLSPLVVPCEGKLCIFGGEHGVANWIEIYSPKSRLWEKREVPYSALPGPMFPSSYFLWEDSSNSHKKTLIVLYFFYDNHQWLMSYDVKANGWEEVDCNFPPVPKFCPRKLVRLGCSHYLLIVDFAPMWYIYDFSKKKLVAKVPVDGLEDGDGWVSNIFCCHHSSQESLIYVFMEPNQMVVEEEEEEEEAESSLPRLVSYARVRLQLQTFSAKIESKGYLRVGPHMRSYIFAVGDEGNKENIVV